MGAKISVFAVLQKHRVDRSGRSAINIRIDLNNKPIGYDNLGGNAPKIDPEYWDVSRRLVRSDCPNAVLINHRIKTRIPELEGLFMLKEQQGFKLNARNIKLFMRGEDPGQCFYTFCETQIKEKYDNPETIRTYSSEITKLKKYRQSLSFADIDYRFLQGYAAHMRDKLKNVNNTIWKTFKFISTMINDAVRIGGIIEESPFGRDKFDRGSYKQTPRTFLTKSERTILEQKMNDPLPDMHRVILAYLLFMCYCGLRFEDALSFNYDQHVVENERIIMLTQKKEYQVNIKLYPKLRETLLFIRENPLQISNQKFNMYLKAVASLAGIEKKITAHVGRHSFGRLLAENGVDKSKAQKLLGHFDSRSTSIYYHMLDTDLDQEVDSKLGNL